MTHGFVTREEDAMKAGVFDGITRPANSWTTNTPIFLFMFLPNLSDYCQNVVLSCKINQLQSDRFELEQRVLILNFCIQAFFSELLSNSRNLLNLEKP